MLRIISAPLCVHLPEIEFIQLMGIETNANHSLTKVAAAAEGGGAFFSGHCNRLKFKLNPIVRLNCVWLRVCVCLPVDAFNCFGINHKDTTYFLSFVYCPLQVLAFN